MWNYKIAMATILKVPSTNYGLSVKMATKF